MANSDKFDLVGVHHGGGYGSEFESDSEAELKRAKRKDLIPHRKRTTDGVAHKREVGSEYSKEEGRTMRFHFLSMDAYARHKQMVNSYMMYYGGKWKDFTTNRPVSKTDLDIIRDNHQFLWDEEDEDNSWEKRMAKKYYDKLFKEYCIADLSRYKENKIALRWRIEKECIVGKGQFTCGNKKCDKTDGLRSWEVNFGYTEKGEKKNALVKLRLCPDCSYKLNYHHKKREIKKARKEQKHTEVPDKRQKLADDKETAVASASSSQDAVQSSEQALKAGKSESEIWSGPIKLVDEKSREEEFDDYFEDMFL